MIPTKFRRNLDKEAYFATWDTEVDKLTEEIKDTIYNKYQVKCEVFQRDEFLCQNDECITPDSPLTLHHVKWQKNGGEDKARNCLTLCKTCHLGYHKGKRVLKIKDRVELPEHFRGHTYVLEKKDEINWKEVKARMKELRKNVHHLHGVELTPVQMTILMNFLFMPYEEWEE